MFFFFHNYCNYWHFLMVNNDLTLNHYFLHKSSDVIFISNAHVYELTDKNVLNCQKIPDLKC